MTKNSNARDPVRYLLDKTDKVGDCRIFHGAKACGGYGIMKNEFGKLESAHRYFYRQFNGEIPYRVTVYQTCRNRLCMEPTHLKLFRGNRGNYKLSVVEAKDILRKRLEGRTCEDLAEEYGVSDGTISSISLDKRGVYLISNYIN